MNLFEVVKASINTQEAAQMYGIDVNHHGTGTVSVPQ